MWLANMNWLVMSGTKLAGVKSCVIVKKSVFGGLPMGRGGVGGLCLILLTDLYPGYVVGKYELARCVG